MPHNHFSNLIIPSAMTSIGPNLMGVNQMTRLIVRVTTGKRLLRKRTVTLERGLKDWHPEDRETEREMKHI